MSWYWRVWDWKEAGIFATLLLGVFIGGFWNHEIWAIFGMMVGALLGAVGFLALLLWLGCLMGTVDSRHPKKLAKRARCIDKTSDNWMDEEDKWEQYMEMRP